jgi:YbbR domain-containing protein
MTIPGRNDAEQHHDTIGQRSMMMDKRKRVKKSKKNWIDNNQYLLILSMVVAALVWIVVAMTVGRGGYSQEFRNVPVDISLQTDAFTRLGFNPIEASATLVTAKVEGDRVAITSQESDAFLATVSIPENLDIDRAGTYSLPLIPADADYDRTLFTAIEYEPSTVQVKFDRTIEKAFALEVVKNGMSVAAGYVLGAETVSPSQVMIEGPQAEIEKIARCRIVVELLEPLDKNHSATYPIEILDDAGQEIDLEAGHMTVDYTEARLLIEMLQNTSLSLKTEIINIPRNFPIAELRYSITADTLEVAAPLDLVDKVTELVVGHIDMRTINKDSYTYTFPVEVPEYYRSMDAISQVTVRFFSSGWEEAYFSATGIELLNAPDDYDIRILGGETVHNIKFVGRPEILEEMTADDIVMEIDFSEREVILGQSQVPVKISVPTKGLVWAANMYSAVIQVTEKEVEEE